MYPSNVTTVFKHSQLALTLLVLATQCFAAGIVLKKLYPELELKDGRVLKNVTFVASTSTTAMAKWDGGMGTIRLSLLPDDMGSADQVSAPNASRTLDAISAIPFDGSAAPSAEALAERSLLAEGGPALLALKAIRFQGEMGPVGGGTPIVIVASQPNFRRTEILLPQGRYIEGYGPKGAWYATQKSGEEAVLAKPPEQSAAASNDLDESFIEPLWRWKELHAKLNVTGQELVTMQDSNTSIRTYVVSVSVPVDPRWDYLIPADDQTTPYLVRRSYRDNAIVATVRRSRFRRIASVVVPMQYEFDDGNGHLVDMRFFRVVLNPDTNPEAFLGPLPAASKEAHF